MSTPLIHPDLGNGLTNHEPMVISALRDLGASKAHIAKYHEIYGQNTRTVDETRTSIDNVRTMLDWLGKQANYRGLYDFFATQIDQTGAKATVNTYVHLLADGVSGGALHPLIRLGHAVHDNDNSEITAALAYWAWTYQPLPWPEASLTGEQDPVEVLKNLRKGQPWPSETELNRPTITEEFANVTSLPGYHALSIKLNDDALSLPKLKQLAIRVFWMHDDFILLHCVTAIQALERLALWMDKPEVLFQPIWRTLVVAWLVKDLHWQLEPENNREPELTIPQIRTLAAHAFNDHTVKLVAACLEGYQKTGDKLYWLAAERRVMNDKQTAGML